MVKLTPILFAIILTGCHKDISKVIIPTKIEPDKDNPLCLNTTFHYNNSNGPKKLAIILKVSPNFKAIGVCSNGKLKPSQTSKHLWYLLEQKNYTIEIILQKIPPFANIQEVQNFKGKCIEIFIKRPT